jgi:glycosyltransferase involved in cell wall biosynthesis
VANNISVTILAKNSAATLRECLQALEAFEEVILLDTGSTDQTMEIANSFANVVVHSHPFAGFGPMKNLAIEKASNDWILSIDSDEIVSPELVQEILHLDPDPGRIYEIERDNYYHRRLVRCCGWEHDRVIRLFNRQATRFNDNLVHEYLLPKAQLQTMLLKGRLRHYTFDNASELIDKIQHYSTLWAKEHAGRKTSSPLKALLRGAFVFFKSFIIQKGILGGYEGLVISVSNANGAFYKYIKLYEARKSGPDL